VEKRRSNLSWEEIRKGFYSTGNAPDVLPARTRLVDEEILEAYSEFLAGAFGENLALLAVGGYGRRELFPYSDIDLLFLVEQPPQEGVRKEALSRFLREIWDSGLRLSHSVRTVADCCEIHDGNIELSVSLLDMRHLAGSSALYQKLEARFPKFIAGQKDEISKQLLRLTRARHAKFHETIYHLEPNIKETPGALRDLHLIDWLGKLRPAGAGDIREDLDAARQFIFTLRCFLHYESRRDNNALTFDAQEQICDQPFIAEKDPAQFMRQYFRHARGVYGEALRAIERAEGPGGGLLASFRDWRSRLSNADFTVSRERIFLRSPQQLDADPLLVIRLFTFVARHGIRPSLDTERRVAGHLPALISYYASPRALWPALQELLSLPHAALALRLMLDNGVLKAIVSEWERIECLVVRDFYHRYTVDEHSLMAIQSLLYLSEDPDPARKKFALLFEEVELRSVLLFALLLHDIGKGSGREHVEESLELAWQIMDRIQVPVEHRQLVHFLIDKHLELSSVTASRDLDDPGTAEYLAHKIGTVERLKMLTLLTYADISAVNPGAMTPWRLDQLWRVYLITHQELTRELDSERIGGDPELGVEIPLDPELRTFLEGFPTRYLRTHTLDEIQQHAALARRSRAYGVAVELVRSGGVYRLDLVSRDRPFLFASLAGALSSFGMNILKAEAFANREGHVLDTFTFSDPHRTLELNPVESDRLQVMVQRVALGKVEVRELLQNRPKPSPPSRRSKVSASVSFDGSASQSATLVEIVAEDRPGLLYDLASVLSTNGCNIEVVLIDTEAHKALDVFYVTTGGRKLSAEEQDTLRQNMLQICT
jgi:[protein-PII] uridylyltransferase